MSDLNLSDKLVSPFVIDDVEYDPKTLAIKSINRSFQVLDGSKAGRSLGGSMLRDIIGTYYNYTITFDAKIGHEDVYEQLYETLSAPVDYHTLSLPFANKTITQKMYVTSGNDKLVRFRKDGENFFNELSIQFVAMNPFSIPH